MTQEPTVSVIIPFLDTPEAFFIEAVESVRAQTYPHWELILVDDGSGAESTSVAMDYVDSDPRRIRYCEHEGHANLGPSASRNLGIRNSKGDLVAFLDADDFWFPSKIEEQVALMQAHPRVGMVYGRTEYWHSWTGLKKDAGRDYSPRLGVGSGTIVPPPEMLIRYLRGAAAVPCPCSVMVRRTTVDQVGGFEDTFRGVHEDQVFFARVCLEAPVMAVDRCWDRYRQWDGSACTTAEAADRVRDSRLAYLQGVFERLEERGVSDPRLVRALKGQLIDLEQKGALHFSRLLRYVGRRARKISRRLWDGFP